MVTLTQLDVQIGYRIRLLRMERGITQDKLARALEISFQQVQKYERGINRVTVGRLFQMAQLFRIPVGYFFRGMGLDALADDAVRHKDGSKSVLPDESGAGVLGYSGLSERQEPLSYLSYQEEEQDFDPESVAGFPFPGEDTPFDSSSEEEEIRAEEAKYLLEAFYRIENGVIRHQIFEMVCVLASQSGRRHKNSDKTDIMRSPKSEKP